ncbi:hypothetical protein AVEN_182020-1 [Araneus ventricosus]|uniref:Uncharacterized protein n=1 Tax=Araneus ventricosus TaxID=182803 RepID=A0A4Y2VJG4_ARAVE|nr:hypothetical protein AVEN_182020-1 [Araneus ventricosus]
MSGVSTLLRQRRKKTQANRLEGSRSFRLAAQKELCVNSIVVSNVFTDFDSSRKSCVNKRLESRTCFSTDSAEKERVNSRLRGLQRVSQNLRSAERSVSTTD